MPTNLDVITDALRKANILNEREIPSSAQSESGLTLLNDMMSDWEEDGIELGYFPQTSNADTFPVEDKFLRGVKYNLARGIAGDYGIDLPPEALRIADLTFDRLAQATAEEAFSKFDHMPTGGRRGFDVTEG